MIFIINNKLSLEIIIKIKFTSKIVFEVSASKSENYSCFLLGVYLLIS